MALILHAPAKINLYLKVQNRRQDGYHNIHSLMQMVGLYDTLTFQEDGAHIRLEVAKAKIPNNNSNLILRAARMLQKEMGKTDKISRGVTITLEKNIPVAAGLGGGSADAAATLVGLNQLWSLGLSRSHLAKLGGYVGSDVPFFFYGPTAWVSGKGDRVKKETSTLHGFIVLVFSGDPVSTAEIFHQIGQEIDLTKRGNTLNMRKAKMRNVAAAPSVQEVLYYPENDLEKVTLKAQPNLVKVKALLESFGGEGALMSGSGPTVFARFGNEDHANDAASSMRGLGYKDVWVAKMLTRAPRGFGSTTPARGGWGSPRFSDSI
ncbi:MAG: 4-(cytidine 5'-diphospho)-2-C-methyl-D-erythritol kinase [Nitrospirae bacterium]|nr:4-(cytidine 5'-diphospho)-2-C-methyl-D-erythritol kinase [Candidatus Troglogloeales bacterium]